MTHPYPKRLIEVDLPIKRISAHSRREKSIRHGHISTLHIWWARRPLAACRSVICAALWPDPADPLCPQDFRDKASKLITDFANAAVTNKALGESCDHQTWIKWQSLTKTEGLDSRKEAHWNVLRFALLDFIADFANWDNSTVHEYLETSRALTQAAHEALGGDPSTRPLVVDPFAGGGSIPLEALRVGADAFASDLNPVPVLLNQVLLEYIPKFGRTLRDEVERSCAWMTQRVEKDLARFYPLGADHKYPVAYLWARTIICEGPGCGVSIPLIRSDDLDNRTHQRLKLSTRGDRIEFEIAKSALPLQTTIKAGSASCPRCGYSTPSDHVRKQLATRNGGTSDAFLTAVVSRADEGVRFTVPTDRELTAIIDARAAAPNDLLGKISNVRPAANTRGVSAVTAIGIHDFRDIFSPRQRLLLECLSNSISELWATRREHFETDQFAVAVCSVLTLITGRLVDYCSSLCTWVAGGAFVGHTFTKQALPNVWDYAEVNPLSGGSGSIESALNWVLRVIDANTDAIRVPGNAVQADARNTTVPNGSADLAFTDPPYYAEIPYADISDFFYIWLRRCMSSIDPELFAPSQVDREKELIVTKAFEGIKKDARYFEDGIRQAASSLRESTKASGLLVFVFANAKTSAWESMLQALINAKLRVVASWPIDTERAARTRAQKAASLQSSVHIVCRPRESTGDDAVGGWRDVLSELPLRIHEWMPRLHDEGVVGADAIFACLGPALEVFSRYERVEKANGDVVTLNEYLEHVWAAVAKEALATVFKGADATGFEPDARLTAMWLWTMSAPDTIGSDEDADEQKDSEDEPQPDDKTKGGFSLEFDAARKIAQGLGANLDTLRHLVEVSGTQARLLAVSERTRYLFGKDQEDPTRTTDRKRKSAQLDMFAELTDSDGAEDAWREKTVKRVGDTTLDRVHQGMILFAASRGEALKRFIIEDGVGRDGRFWRLAQALSALYPSGSEEKRWVGGVLARKKQFGF